MHTGLSLTHVLSDGQKLPLELTLSSDPARLGASVLREYKPTELNIVQLPQMSSTVPEPAQPAVSTDAATPAAPGSVSNQTLEQTPLESMMSRLSENDKEIFIARLTEAETAYNLEKQRVADAETKMAKTNKILSDRTADGKLVQEQIAYLSELLAQSGAALEAERVKEVPSMLGQSPAHTEYALERVVQACSRALAGNPSGAHRAPKRRAVDSSSAALPSPVAAPAASGSGSISGASGSAPAIRNLLRSTFDGM